MGDHSQFWQNGAGTERELPVLHLLHPLGGAAPVQHQSTPAAACPEQSSAQAGLHSQNSLEGGRDGVLTGVEAVRVLILRNTAWRRCRRCARELAASGVFFQ